MSLHKDRELQKFDLAKKMVLSGLLPHRRNWLFTEKFQLFLNGERIESSVYCSENVDFMEGNMVLKLFLN